MRRLHFVVVVRDKTGRVVSCQSFRGRSYVKGDVCLLNVQARNTNDSCVCTDGLAYTLKPYSSNYDMTAAAADATHGIVFGIGSTAVSIQDYSLESICDEGTSANHLNYQAVTVSDLTATATSMYYTVTRSAINNSGSTITVTEVGIQVKARQSDDTQRYICICREVLATSQDVPDGGAITAVATLEDEV